MSTHPLTTLIAHDATRWYARHRVTLRTAPPWAVAAVAATGLFVVAGALFTAWQTAHALTGAVWQTARVLADGHLTHLVLDPIRAFLRAHADGLRVDDGRLFGAWAVIMVVLFALATTGSRGARVGWCAMSAVSLAMVWTTASADTRVMATGLGATAWALLAIPAFAATHRQPPTVVVQQPPARDTTVDPRVGSRR